MSRGREKKGSHAIMLWEPCNHLQVTTLETLLLMNRSITRALRRSPKEQDGSGNCALHFNFSIKKSKGIKVGEMLRLWQCSK